MVKTLATVAASVLSFSALANVVMSSEVEKPIPKIVDVELSEYSAMGLYRKAEQLFGYRNETVRWRRTYIQENDYVVVFFPEVLSAQFEQPFLDASVFWNNVIISSGEDPLTFDTDFSINNNVGSCSGNPDFVIPGGTVLTGVGILAVVAPIDGVNGILGQAGPCGFTNNVPRLGRMTFDSADAQALINGGSFSAVVKHEMGHVIGIGTSWGNLVQNRCTSFNPCNGDPRYVGTNGLQGFAELGGTGQLNVANEGGAGTANAHWRENTFDNELMTGFLNGRSQPMSIMTVKSLIDIGYEVNLNAAEAFQIPGVPLPGTTAPTKFPTTLPPTLQPTKFPVVSPTSPPTTQTTSAPTKFPVVSPTNPPTTQTTSAPTKFPVVAPTTPPTTQTTSAPTESGIDLGNDTDPNGSTEDVGEALQRFKDLGTTIMIVIGVLGFVTVFMVAGFIATKVKGRNNRRVSRNPKAAMATAAPIAVQKNSFNNYAVAAPANPGFNQYGSPPPYQAQYGGNQGALGYSAGMNKKYNY